MFRWRGGILGRPRALEIAQALRISSRLAPADEWMLGDLARLIAEVPKK
jgi:hypothetical protein